MLSPHRGIRLVAEKFKENSLSNRIAAKLLPPCPLQEVNEFHL